MPSDSAYEGGEEIGLLEYLEYTSVFDSDSEFPHQILSKGKHSASRSGPIVSMPVLVYFIQK